MSELAKGRKHSEETIKKMSLAKKGNTIMQGRTHSDETRKKMSETRKGRTLSDTAKQKVSLFQRNKEGVKGYSFHKASKKYKARIKVRGKQIDLGLFNTPEEASEAYQQAKLIYHT
jgi:hypothetical protein